ncbi:MAG: hypothetical protein KAW17_09715 [Candidatus Eisenbacteria sp.]|nr:hypothetical protein [Candidatus Eisenbacteria bacterium]
MPGDSADMEQVGIKVGVEPAENLQPTLRDVKDAFGRWASEVGTLVEQGFAPKEKLRALQDLGREAKSEAAAFRQESRSIAREDIQRLKEEARRSGAYRKQIINDQIRERQDYARMDEQLVREHSGRIRSLEKQSGALRDLPGEQQTIFTQAKDVGGRVAGLPGVSGLLGIGRSVLGGLGVAAGAVGALGAGMFLYQGIRQAKELENELTRVTRRLGEVEHAAMRVGQEFGFTRHQMLPVIEAFATYSTLAAGTPGFREGVRGVTTMGRFWGVEPGKLAPTAGTLEYLTGNRFSMAFMQRLAGGAETITGGDSARARLIGPQLLEQVTALARHAAGAGVMDIDPNVLAGYMVQVGQMGAGVSGIPGYQPFMPERAGGLLQRISQNIIGAQGAPRALAEYSIRELAAERGDAAVAASPMAWATELSKGLFSQYGADLLGKMLALAGETHPETIGRQEKGYELILSRLIGVSPGEARVLYENRALLGAGKVGEFRDLAGGPESILAGADAGVSRWQRMDTWMSEMKTITGEGILTHVGRIAEYFDRLTRGKLGDFLFGKEPAPRPGLAQLRGYAKEAGQTTFGDATTDAMVKMALEAGMSPEPAVVAKAKKMFSTGGIEESGFGVADATGTATRELVDLADATSQVTRMLKELFGAPLPGPPEPTAPTEDQ